ncbi:RNA methyltransferase [Rhizobium sp. TRM95111]|uniref:TrmH family RNA methyltransferase n=1 Tax=Rhizobium alarense TaxID=2846851 RepID=UPI001F3A586E|nr:RNA methyltransferase [Rhizobium alarense]MCF3638371.1 RNA methyltransferase [Rhizobium alarense]
MAAALLRIVDPADPRIAAFTAIRERDLTGREGRFVAEGTVVLNMLASVHGGKTGFRAEALLLLENRIAGLEKLLERFPPNVPAYVADANVFDRIAGFHMHRGVLAIGVKPQDAAVEAVIAGLPETSLVLVASGIANHDNIGAMFRNAAAFGADAVLLDSTCCDPLYRKAIRVSVGAVLAMPHAREGRTEEHLERLAAAGFDIWALSPRGSVRIGDIPASRRVALVVGTEGEGLPERIMQRFRTARVPQAPGLDSLNVATASGVALYQMALAAGRLG